MSLFRRRRADLGTTEAADSPAPSAALPPAPHLLVCDDNVTVTKVLALMFDRAGWTVEVTDTGRECLLALERRVPDVIVLDQRFYFGLNGLETAALARERGFDRPIVLFSAHLDTAARQRAEQLELLPVSKVDTAAVVRHVNEAHRSYRARTATPDLRRRRAAASRSAPADGPARLRAEGLNAEPGEAPA
jgi:CheY-like chemotaxis protein